MRCFSGNEPTSVPVTGTAAYNVTPTKSGIYLNKLNASLYGANFAPGESRDMGVQFFDIPNMPKDPYTATSHDHAVLYDVPQTPPGPVTAGGAARPGRAETRRT